MHWTSIAAITSAAALNAAVVRPLWARYTAWRDGPRVIVARRDWRGRYVPDLTLIRLRRLAWASYIIMPIIGIACLLLILSPSS